MPHEHLLIDQTRQNPETVEGSVGTRLAQLTMMATFRERWEELLEQASRLQAAQGLLGRDVPWSTIEAATGIDEAAFRRLKQQFDDTTAPVTPNGK